MISLTLHEKKAHTTGDFPGEYHFVNSAHPRYNMPFHWHREWEIIIVREGEVRFTVDNRDYSAKSDDILIVPGGCLHAGTPQTGSVYECLVFDFTALFSGSKDIKKYLSPFFQFEERPMPFFSAKEFPSICRSARYIMEACSDRSSLTDFDRLIAAGSVAQLFGLILQGGYVEMISAPDDSAYGRIAQIKSVLEYIEQNYSQLITLDLLSAVAGLNSKYFCQVFRQVTHRTPIDYLVFYRLEQACIMLSSTRRSVTEICMSCGFNDSGYFARKFRAQYGMTPLAYRRKFST